MKKLVSIALLAVAIVIAAAGPGHARGGGGRGGHGGHTRGHFHGHRGFHGGSRAHVFVGVGPLFYWPYFDPYPWYYPPYPSSPIVVQEPPVYVQRPPQGYWYYCQSAKAYYPNVHACPEGWIPVPPRAP